MDKVGSIALDILREALARRLITRILIVLGIAFVAMLLGLELTIVDGVLSSARLFGGDLNVALRSPELALHPVFNGAAFLLFFGGAPFGAVACSGFAPELLMPGRIEQLLALPLQRWHLIAGIYLGVLAIALLSTLYLALLVTLLFGIKAGVWSASVIAAALATLFAFAAVYGVMLLVSCVTRSAAQSTSGGIALFGLALSVTRRAFTDAFEPGWKRITVQLATGWLPRLDTLSHVGSVVAAFQPLQLDMLRAAGSALAFGLACVSLAVWVVERKDF